MIAAPPIGVLLSVLLAVLLGGLVAVACVAVSYNRFVSQRQSVASAWATVDTELDRRYRLVPLLAASVRAAGAHEREVLVHVVEAGARLHEARSDPSLQSLAEPWTQAAIAQLIALRTAHPQLASNTNFVELQRQLAMVEDRIAAARRFYNTRVVVLNERVESFPSNVVARIARFEKAAYFGTQR